MRYGFAGIPIAMVVVAGATSLIFLFSRLIRLARGNLPQPCLMYALLLLLLVQGTCIKTLALSLLPGIAAGLPVQHHIREFCSVLPTIILIAPILSILTIAWNTRPFVDPSDFAATLLPVIDILRVLETTVGIAATIFGISLLTELYARYAQKPPAAGPPGIVDTIRCHVADCGPARTI